MSWCVAGSKQTPNDMLEMTIKHLAKINGQYYKHTRLVNYNSTVVLYAIY